jgi:hypothetical protein
MYRVSLAVLCAALAGCPAEEPPACITVDTACAPLYEPTFDNVYAMTIKNGCGSDRSACHSAAGQGGVSFADPQSAYDGLRLGLVKPGDPGCSEMIVRTSSPGEDYEMPPGAPLSPAARCALIQWVAAGAPGPGQALTGGNE